MGFLSGKKKQQQQEAGEGIAPEYTGSRSKNASPAPNANPYARPENLAAQDPYARPANSYGAQGPPSYSNGGQNSMDQFRREKSPVPPGGYGGGPRYTAQGRGYENENGYGSRPYGREEQRPAQSRYGSGGYGNLGRSNSQDTVSTDAGREQLFGKAHERVQGREPQPRPPNGGRTGPTISQPADPNRDQLFGGAAARYQPRQQSDYANGYSNADNYAGGYGAPDNYKSYEDVEQDRGPLTEQEIADADADADKAQIKMVNKDTADRLANARNLALAASDHADRTLAMLAQDSESFQNVEANLLRTEYEGKTAHNNTKILQKTNASMLYRGRTSESKIRKDQAADDALRQDIRKRTDDSVAAHQSELNRMGAASRQPEQRTPGQRSALASRYTFEADESDEEREERIEDDMQQLSFVTSRLKSSAQTIGRTIDSQNKTLDRIGSQTDKVDDQIHFNRDRLARIK